MDESHHLYFPTEALVCVPGVSADQDTLYAGLFRYPYAENPTGGCFKSTNGGGLWVPSMTGFSSFYDYYWGLQWPGVCAIAVDPQNPAKLYASTGITVDASTGDLGGGLYRSMDGGGTWLPTGLLGYSNWRDLKEYVTAIAIDPNDPRIVYAGTLSQGVFRSEDAGGTFVSISGGLPPYKRPYHPDDITYAINTLIFDANTAGAGTTLYAATNGGGVYKWSSGLWTDFNGTASGGQSPAGSQTVLALEPRTSKLYVGIFGRAPTDGVYSTTVDCTETWCRADIPPRGEPGCEAVLEGQAPPCRNWSFSWDFGDGSPSATGQRVVHTYATAGRYTCTMTADPGQTGCTSSGVVEIGYPGDCDLDGVVTIGEIQKAINGFLGVLSPPVCGTDRGDGSVSIGDVQTAINMFLGTPPPNCPSGGRSGVAPIPVPEIRLAEAEGFPGATVAVPIRLRTNGAMVSAASYRVFYDPHRLTFAGAQISQESARASKSIPTPVDAIPGWVNLAVVGTGNNGPVMLDANHQPLAEGDLATLYFTIREGVRGVVPLVGSCGASDPDGNDLPTACAQGSVTVPTLAGRVTLGGEGLAGVAVAAGPYSATTDPSGAWAVGGVAAGSYAVTPSRAGYAFAPASRSVTFAGGALYGLDFAASEDFRISGSVTFMEEGTPVSGVAVSAVRAEGGAYAAATDAAGAFLFGGLPTGSYTVTPSKTGLLFSPADFGVIPLSGEWTAEEGVSFQAFPTGPYRISGFVREGGVALPGVRLRLDGWPQEATTNALGHYSIGSLASGYDYAVLPSMRCKRFTPAYLDVFDLAGDVGSQSFAASQVSLCQPCFAELDLEMARCLGAPDPPSCSEGARVRFGACLHEATAQANTPLYEATLLAIAVPRAAGQPVPVTVPLGVEAEGDYFVNVVNGDQANGETMVTSATVDLSGAGRVFGPGDFKKQVPFLSAPVHLAPGAYELSVEVRGQPGSYLTVVVSDLDFGTIE